MSFIDDFIDELNKVPTYEIDDDGKKFKAIRCDLVCDILSVLLDKYEIGENDDIHG